MPSDGAHLEGQGLIQEFASGDVPFPLEVGSPLNQLGCLGSAVTNLVHSKAVRKTLVAIILSILTCTL